MKVHELFNIEGKKAIVTGGSKGLGKGMAEALLEAGCEVAITSSSDAALLEAENYRAAGYACYGVKGDLRKREEVYSSFEECLKHLKGDVDILVTAAGINLRHPSEEFPMDDWDDVINVNLNAQFIQCQLAGRIMLKKGYGKIIIVGSLCFHFGGSTIPAYAASKGGVSQLAKALSNDWMGKGINVNAVAPGYMATDLNTALLKNETRYRQITERIPAGRWGNGDDMKGITLFLASQASDYVGGAVIPVDGSYLVR